ncbi:MAG: cell wall-binding repeat-containing protein, partial [Actinomycetota bacterium]
VAAIPYSPDVDYRRPKLTVVPGDSRSTDAVYITSWACEGRSIPLSTGFCTDVVFSASSDSGKSFTQPVPVNSFTTELASALDNSQIVVASDGSIHVVYRTGGGPTTSLRLASSRDQGETWEQSTVRSGFRAQRGFIDPKLAIDRADDTLYLAYEEATASSGSDIFVQASTDAGAMWSSPARVNDDTTATHQIAPWVSVADDGRIHLTWFDQRHAYPGNSLEDVYYAHSTDGGKTFSSNRRVTDRVGNRDVGYKPRLGVFAPVNTPISGNRVLVAWADSRRGDYVTASQDIYLARIDLDARAPIPIDRLRFSGPVATSVGLSRLAYPGGGEIVADRAATRVVVVNAAEATDALVAGVLARANLGPVLLSRQGEVPASVVREIKRLEPVGAYLIGGESRLSNDVQEQLVDAGVEAEGIERVSADDPAGIARLVAGELDRRSDAQKLMGEPAFSQVVIVNPASASALAAGGIAAQLRIPILHAAYDSLPEATGQALEELNIDKTLVVGGASDISDALLTELPDPTRIGGEDVFEVSRAVNADAVERGLPVNLAYTTTRRSDMATALLGYVAARRGGLLLMAPGSPASARTGLRLMKIDARVDRIVRVAPAR